MDSQVMHSYIMKQTLNFEYDVYRETLRKFGVLSKKFDSVVLISGVIKGDLSQWQGLSQSIKRFITLKNDDMSEQIQKVKDEVNDQIRVANENMIEQTKFINENMIEQSKIVNDSLALMKAQLDQLVKNQEKNERSE